MRDSKKPAHEVVRYQGYRQRKGWDLACRCGRRWYLQDDSRDYPAIVEAVALHFDWPGVPSGTPEKLRNWLEEKLPEHLQPKLD